MLHDGDTVVLGGVTLTAHRMGGHTRGCTTWTFRTHISGDPAGRLRDVAIVSGWRALSQYRLVDTPGHRASYPGIKEEFYKSFATLRTAIFANDYGQAAAIDFFGLRYGLPASFSKAEAYWLWGPRQFDGQSVIVLGSDGRGDREHFRSVEAAAKVNSEYLRDDERYTILVCREIYPPLRVLWPHMKAW